MYTETGGHRCTAQDLLPQMSPSCHVAWCSCAWERRQSRSVGRRKASLPELRTKRKGTRKTSPPRSLTAARSSRMREMSGSTWDQPPCLMAITVASATFSLSTRCNVDREGRGVRGVNIASLRRHSLSNQRSSEIARRLLIAGDAPATVLPRPSVVALGILPGAPQTPLTTAHAAEGVGCDVELWPTPASQRAGMGEQEEGAPPSDLCSGTSAMASATASASASSKRQRASPKSDRRRR
mmetsp:Transcript_5306/g.10551  ORF Transcript_5306/g.10551 Transcript_5306/m.10551 type:complete len:239 (+) Transcript_5306:39-755(+)